MSPEPTVNYDELHTAIVVDMDAINSAATTLETRGKNVATGLVNINNTLSGLRLGWVGTTAAEVEAFSNRWVTVATALFGTEAANNDDDLDSKDGVLNVMIVGLKSVVAAWNKTDHDLKAYFDGMAAGLNPDNTSTSTGGEAPPTAVTETFGSGS
ncbi:hypothetical protein [Actinoplanes sp. HUAS TT8]|uniref:hypothetical protein n=1 Tax=Actinoplanes sp. HUAS TT8 TaxID=3447453 RepID=UPI003F524D8F